MIKETHFVMKVISFIFEKITTDIQQVYWAIDNILQPFVHHVVLIFILPEVMYTYNDPYTMLSMNRMEVANKKERERLTKEFLISVDKTLRSFFGDNIEVSKLVITGNEYKKLTACLISLNCRNAVLGRDTEVYGFKKFFFGSYDDFLLQKLGITVIRVPQVNKKFRLTY